ncbi:MAG: amino acid ABC transporter ATP-binding protein [Acidimicrobiales bacterium]
MSSDAVVELRGVTKRFGERTIFSDVALSVHRREVVAIIGPSGAGKSTLIRCINGLNHFERGSITVLGHQLQGSEEGGGASRQVLRDIRISTGMVFQTFNLFPHLSVLDNIALAPTRVRKVSREDALGQARELLDTVGLGHRCDAYPNRLSGGEQQRAAICRALAMEPKVMLFDEPTSMLDPALVGDVLDVIQGLAERGMTMVLVTHEMMFALEVADTVVVMADGGVVEKGPAREVLTSPGTERARQFLQRSLRYTAAGSSVMSAGSSGAGASRAGDGPVSMAPKSGEGVGQ